MDTHEKQMLKDLKIAGDVVEQIVRAGGPFVRKWKVVELSSGCMVPFLKCKES